MEPCSRRTLVLAVLGFEGGFGVLALLLGWLFGQPAWGDCHVDGWDVLWGVAAALPMLAGFAFCLWAPLGPLRRMRHAALALIRPLFASATVWDLAWIAAVAGITEELFFRGFLQALLCGAFGLWIGVLAASVAFGLMHAVTPTYAVLATLVGVYLGVVWLVSGNLLVVIVAHALYDFLALVYLLRVANGP